VKELTIKKAATSLLFTLFSSGEKKGGNYLGGEMNATSFIPPIIAQWKKKGKKKTREAPIFF